MNFGKDWKAAHGAGRTFQGCIIFGEIDRNIPDEILKSTVDQIYGPY
jgi:hypothetical protein